MGYFTGNEVLSRSFDSSLDVINIKGSVTNGGVAQSYYEQKDLSTGRSSNWTFIGLGYTIKQA